MIDTIIHLIKETQNVTSLIFAILAIIVMVILIFILEYRA